MITNIAWYEKYRPSRIEDFVFSNDDIHNLVSSWIESKYIDGNVLLSGPPGTGKTTLAIILIKNIITNQADLCRLKTRSVAEIDEVVKPFIIRAPVSSKIKIVYIEEIDRISRQGQYQLKEDLMEKYQKYVSFIGCTNYPRRLDPALRSRFNYKITLDELDVNKAITRIKYILDSEQCSYNYDDLVDFVARNINIGLRDLINQLQMSAITNKNTIDFKNLTITSSLNLENEIYKLVTDMIDIVLKTNDSTQRKLFIFSPLHSTISKEYQQFVTICTNNYDINYETILLQLYESIKFVPAQLIISRFIEELETKKFPHIHFISCINEIIKCIVEASL